MIACVPNPDLMSSAFLFTGLLLSNRLHAQQCAQYPFLLRSKQCGHFTSTSAKISEASLASSWSAPVGEVAAGYAQCHMDTAHALKFVVASMVELHLPQRPQRKFSGTQLGCATIGGLVIETSLKLPDLGLHGGWVHRE